MTPRSRRRLTRDEEMIRAISECSKALRRAYRHPEVTQGHLRTILAILLVLHVSGSDAITPTVIRRGETISLVAP